MATLQINSSDFAKYCGLNNFCTEEDAVRQFWTCNLALARRLRVDFLPLAKTRTDECIQRAGKQETEKLKSSLGLDADASTQQVSEALRATVVQPSAAKTTVKQVDATLRDAVASHSIGDTLAAALTQDVRMQRGVRLENSVIDTLEVSTGRKVIARNKEYMRSVLYTFRDYSVVLVGMVDGRFADTGHVVEIKERQRRLFGKIVSYERAQLHCYAPHKHTRGDARRASGRRVPRASLGL